MTHTCQIRWIDQSGQSTEDTSPAIGRVRTRARVEQIGGRGVNFPQSEWYCICARHARQLHEPGMHIWEFEPFEVSA